METIKAKPCYNTGCMHRLCKYSELQSITHVSNMITFSLSTENLFTNFQVQAREFKLLNSSPQVQDLQQTSTNEWWHSK